MGDIVQGGVRSARSCRNVDVDVGTDIGGQILPVIESRR